MTFEGEHSSGYSPHGDISIDDVSFTPECRPAPHGKLRTILAFGYVITCITCNILCITIFQVYALGLISVGVQG